MPNVILSTDCKSANVVQKCREETLIKYMNQFLYPEITNAVLKFMTKQHNYEILPSSEIEDSTQSMTTKWLFFLISQQTKKNLIPDFISNCISRITTSFEPEIGIV